MGKKTINQALKALFLGLGGDSSALADNSSVSDYIEDLESAIKGAASGVEIDDETASTDTVYSSSKTEDLINSIEALPSVAVGDIGEALIVESDGEGGAQWGKGVIAQDTIVIVGTENSNKFVLPSGVNLGTIKDYLNLGKNVVLSIAGVTNPTFACLYHYSNCKGRLSGTVVQYMWTALAPKTTANNWDVYYICIDGGQPDTTTSFDKGVVHLGLLPAVTSSDNDKILKVVNGVWTAVTPQ